MITNLWMQLFEALNNTMLSAALTMPSALGCPKCLCRLTLSSPPPAVSRCWLSRRPQLSAHQIVACQFSSGIYTHYSPWSAVATWCSRISCSFCLSFTSSAITAGGISEMAWS